MLTFIFLVIAFIAVLQICHSFTLFLGPLIGFRLAWVPTDVVEGMMEEDIVRTYQDWGEVIPILIISLSLAGLSYLNTLPLFETIDYIKMLMGASL